MLEREAAGASTGTGSLTWEFDLSLVLDRRAELSGSPGTHALVIGISDYPHLPVDRGVTGDPTTSLHGLTVAARSGYEFQSWLAENKDRLVPPLKTLRVLLAPSDKELEAIPALEELRSPCATEQILDAAYDWRGDAQQSSRDMTIFYFCGNGFDLRPAEPMFSLADFGSLTGPKLRGSVLVSNIVQGMAPSIWCPNIARTQLFFFDAGRRAAAGFQDDAYLGATQIFDIGRPQLDDRRMALCHATSPGTTAYGLKGSITHFLVALKQCLQGRAAISARADGPGQPLWCVTIDSLAKALPEALEESIKQTPKTRATTQHAFVSSMSGDVTIVNLEGPPLVPVQVTVDPPEAAARASVAIYDAQSRRVEVADVRRVEGGLAFSIAAGLYRVSITVAPRTDDANSTGYETDFIVSLTPPRGLWSVTAPQ